LAIDLGLSLAVAGAGALIVARSLGALERLRLSRAMPDQGCSAADTRSAAGETTPFQEESRRTSAQEARTTLTEEQGTSAKRAGPIPNHYPVPGTARREFRPRRWDGSRRVRAAKSRTKQRQEMRTAAFEHEDLTNHLPAISREIEFLTYGRRQLLGTHQKGRGDIRRAPS